MESKPRAQTKSMTPKRASSKRSQGITETARLFLDVDEVIRRSQQTVSLTRYIE